MTRGNARSAKGLVVLAVAAAAAACAPARPDTVRAAPPAAVAVDADGTRRLGESYLRKRLGISEARFAGNPYGRGYARGKLSHSQIVREDQAIQELLERFVPSSVKRFLLGRVMALNLRGSIPAIPAEHNEEIVGLSDALEPDPVPGEWNVFARHLALHALHDFSQRYADQTPLAAACTGFAASGRATADGHTLLARNFDFEAGDLFDAEKVVAYVVPEGGIPYLSVTFAGLTGVVSGFNREGIGIAIYAWSGGRTTGTGEPATLVAADVLERASTLAEAIRIVERASVFVSNIYMLADGKTGEMAAVEKTPRESAVRRGRDLLFAANHPESAAFSGSKHLNVSSTSLSRRRRVEELVAPLSGRLDVPRAARVLRDRQGRGGKDIGPGNRNAVNALIASHSIVFDLTARRAWVAAAPHGLGPFVAYSLDLGIAAGPADPRFARLASSTLPADPWLVSGGYAAYLSARELTVRGRKVLSDGWTSEALEHAREALRLAPGFAEALALSAEALAAQGRLEQASAAASAALERDPAPPAFARSLEAFLTVLASGETPAVKISYPASPDDLPQD